MPRKIGFTVVCSSSHEDKFTDQELMVHAPTANGWRSNRQCSYPQHVTLQLVDRSRVRKLQLLAHQYLIPTKVEFHIGDHLPETSSPGFTGQLHRLGYVSLSDNEKTGFKARELKSVHVDAIGTYLRITFHKNHANGYNQHNQVALVAINVLGDSLDASAFHTMPSREQLIEHYLNSTHLDATTDTTFMGKCESFSPFDDLAFEMYQDPEVAHIIRLMDQEKQDMVRQEKYEQAKNLKQAIADLQKVGEHLARYDVEKRYAIEKEDYVLAKKKKELMESYRRSVYKQLALHNLLDLTMVARTAQPATLPDPLPPLPSPGQRSAPVNPLVSTETFRKGKKTNKPQNEQPATEPIVSGACGQPENPCTPATLPHVDTPSRRHFDEQPLPALQRKDQPKESLPCPEEHRQRHSVRSPPNTEMSRELEPLTKKAQRENVLPIDVYGERLVAGLHSKSWSFREDALQDLHKSLLGLSPITPEEELRNMARAAVVLVKKALQDKVLSVFQAALKVLRLMLVELIPGLGLGRSEMMHCLEQTWPILLVRTGDSGGRLRGAATAFIQEIAVQKDVRALQLIPAELVKPFKSNCLARLAMSRVELLESLLADLGTENTGFTVDNVMTFCTVALEHSAAQIREPAVRIIKSMYRQHRSAVISHLPPPAARKNFLYKSLFDSFAKMDGKPVESQEQDTKFLKGPATKGTPQVKKESQRAVKATVTHALQKQVSDHETSVSISCQDYLCIFCGKEDESFTEDGLDLHYWKHCPMLCHCSQCRQIVEIASLTEHLLGDCDSSSSFSQCARCSEAVATEKLTQHVQGPNCNPPVSGKGSNHCPLCHNNFNPGEEAWKAHLMGREGCKQNSRRTVVFQKSQAAQGRAVGKAKLKQSLVVGARGSRIPALAPLGKGTTPGKK